ncbi:MAG: MATE family efflux transporter [Bacteroidota bacterium]
MDKEILKLAVPNILSNISVPLISTVDTALMGSLSELHIGAVGLGSMIFNFIYWNFGFLRMGTTGITAQFYGKQDVTNLIHTLLRALMVGLILTLFVVALQKPFLHISIQLLNVPEEQVQILAEYFFIRIWAAPATLALYAFMGWYFGMQNAILPMIITILINVINVAFSWYFVIQLEWNVAGVAWGTVIAQYAGLTFAFLFFIIYYRDVLKSIVQKQIFYLDAFKEFLKINRDIFLRTLMLTFSFGFFYSISSTQGSMMLAVNVILLQFLNWMSYGIDGFAFASESLTGKYYGAADQSKLNLAIKKSFIWAGIFGLLYALIYIIFGITLVQIFSDDISVQQATKPYLFWIVVLPIASFVCYIWDGIFIGLTASKAMRDTMFISLIIYVLSYYLFRSYDNHGLWLSLMLFMIARGGIMTYYYTKKELGLIRRN